MTIAELKELKPGTKLYRTLRNGWIENLTFIQVREAQAYDSITIEQLITGKLPDLSKPGNIIYYAECKYIDDRGKERIDWFKPRQLHRREE